MEARGACERRFDYGPRIVFSYCHSENSNFMTKRKEANRTMATYFANTCLRVLATNQGSLARREVYTERRPGSSSVFTVRENLISDPYHFSTYPSSHSTM